MKMRTFRSTTLLVTAGLLIVLLGGAIVGCRSEEEASVSGPALSLDEMAAKRTEYNKKNPGQYTKGTIPGIAMTMDFTTYHIDGQPYGDWRLRTSWVGSQGGKAEVTTDVAVSMNADGAGSAFIPPEFLNKVVQLIQQKFEEGKNDLGMWWYDKALILELYRDPNGDEKTYEYYNVNLGQPGYTYELSATSVAGGLQQILKALELSWWPGKEGALPQNLALALNIGHCIGVREISPLPTSSPTPQDFALNFDGLDDYVALPAIGSLSEATIDFWCKANSFTDSDFNVIWNANTYGGGNLHLQFRTTGGVTKLNFARPVGDETFAYTFNAGTWYHVTVQYSAGPGTVKLFINGALQETILTSTTAIDATVASRIGAYNSTRFFNGIVDEFRISGTVDGYWNFNEGTGTTAADSVGGFDGTVNGATWTTETP